MAQTLEELLLRLSLKEPQDDDSPAQTQIKEVERNIQASLELCVSNTGSMDVGILIKDGITNEGLDGLARMLFYLTNNPKAVAAEIASLMKDGIKAGTLSEDSITHVMKEWTRLFKENSDVPVIKASEVSGIANMVQRSKER